MPPIVAATDLAHVKVEGRNGQFVPLSEVARLVRGHQPLHGEAVINDGPGILLIVEKFPWANTLDVTQGVDEAMADLAPALTGIDVDTTIFRPASFIEVALANLTAALLIGSLLVFLVLLLFLYDWRTALISLVAIPLSLMTAAMVLHLLGTTINTMVLAGFVISVGVVVDDAIIDIENIVRRLRQHRLAQSSQSTARIILEASIEVRSAIVYATIIDVVAIAPVFFIEGLSGAFFQPLVISVRPGGPRLSARRADGHPRARLHAPAQRADREAAVARRASAAGRLCGRPHSHHPLGSTSVRDGRLGQRGRRRGVAAARPVAPP